MPRKSWRRTRVRHHISPVKIGSSNTSTKILKLFNEKLQSFNVITKKNTDHHSVRVSVNSELWTKYDSLYDMKVGTKGYLVKTGINGGLDIYFGNGSFGEIPASGSSIDVEYLITDGAKGNLTGSKDLTFKFITKKCVTYETVCNTRFRINQINSQ